MPCYDAPKGAARNALPAALRDDAILLPLYEYWVTQRGNRAFPDRADISPHGMGPKLLPHVGLAEIDAANLPESRLRLLGTALVTELGFDPTGKKVKDYASGEHLDSLVALATLMLEQRKPVFGEAPFFVQPHRSLVARRLYLPLSQGGSEPTLMLFGQTFYRPADAAAFHRITHVIL
jgi:hypothetical protein